MYEKEGGVNICYKVLDINCQKGRHCLYSSLMNIFNFYGYDLKESEIFLLFDGFDIRYYFDKNVIVTTLYDEQMNRITPRITDGTRVVSFSNKEDSVNEILCGINSNNPILLRIPNKFLKYNSAYKNSENFDHHIVIYGYDLEKMNAYIADSYMLTGNGTVSMYCGPTSLSDIYYGINAYVIFDLRNKPVWNRDNVSNVFANQLQIFIEDDSCYNGYYRGFFSVKKYIENLVTLKLSSDVSFENQCLSAIFDLKFGCIYHVLDYMIELIQICGINRDNRSDIIDALKGIKSEWGKFFVYLLKIAYSRRKDKIEEAIEYGLELYEQLRNTYKNLSEYLNV